MKHTMDDKTGFESECDGEGCEAMGDLQELWEDVSEAVSDAINNCDGRVNAWHLEHAFMKAGLSVFRLPDYPPKSEG